jgi:hypothetical protein
MGKNGAARKDGIGREESAREESRSLPGAGPGESGTALSGEALLKEVCRLVRLARSHWDAHENLACRRERDRAMILYESLGKPEREKIPQVLRVWLRYRSEKYFGPERTISGRKIPGGAKGKK